MTTEDLRDYISFLIKPILQYPDEFTIDMTDEDTGVLYTISTNQSDFGRIIGKSGATISMIRAIVRIVGITNEIEVVSIELPDADTKN